MTGTPVRLILCAQQEKELIIAVLWFVEADFRDDGCAGRHRNMSKRSQILQEFLKYLCTYIWNTF
jgi:hypothetical protein